MIWSFALCLEISWIMRLKQSGKLQEERNYNFCRGKMGYLRLEIQNKIEKSVLNENSSLNTTKKDTSSHGIGHKKCKTDDAKGRWRVKVL